MTNAIQTAGICSAGIAIVAAPADFHTFCLDQSGEILERTAKQTAAFFGKSVECGKDLAVKRELLAKLEAICPSHTVFASNTFTLSITEIAAGCFAPAGRAVVAAARQTGL